MSPQQAEGLSVDQRSDVFSLGIVLYEMATGTNPFQRATVVSTLSAILRDTPPPIVELRPLPSSLNDIVTRCLEKSPPRRYPSAAELRDALRLLQTNVTAERLAASRPATLLDTVRKPYVAIPVAAILVALVVVVSMSYRRSSRTRWARQTAAGDRAVDRRHTVDRGIGMASIRPGYRGRTPSTIPCWANCKSAIRRP
jgi:serine/threonine protein kinase